MPKNKPEKPYKDFPLYAHSNGQWAKKIRGQTHCFGKWDNWRAALLEYQRCRDDLQAGRSPPPVGGVTIVDLADMFSEAKYQRLKNNELSSVTYKEYDATCKFLVASLGENRTVQSLTSDDFTALRSVIFAGAKGERIGQVAAGNRIRLIRMIFRWGKEQKLFPGEVNFGAEFKVPTKRALRIEKSAKPKREFSADEIRWQIIAASRCQLRAMILLGINCAYGNGDCGRVEMKHLDLDGMWIHFPRPKTGIDRRARLWPETVAVIREWLEVRPRPKQAANASLVFLTRHRGPWHKESADSPISNEFAKLCVDLGMKRKGVNFYALRHTFENVAGEVGDQVAVNFVMGHADDSMAALYTTTMFDSRLTRVSEHVRSWLFSVTPNDTQ